MNDDLHTVLFRTNLEVGGQQLPVMFVTDDTLHAPLQVRVVPEAVRAGNSQGVLAYVNELNRTYKSFKYFVGEDNALILDVCLTAVPEQFEPQLVSLPWISSCGTCRMNTRSSCAKSGWNLRKMGDKDKGRVTVKRLVWIAMLLCCLSTAGLALAAQEPPQAPAPADAAATNLAAPYPTITEKLPPLPVPPASANDAKATAAYIAAVDAYLKAVQSYIDAATNDANRVIEARNAAIQSANQAVADYNAFFKLDGKK